MPSLDVCADHEWQLRDVTFDLSVGAVEDYECLGCGAVTARQPTTEAAPSA